MAKTTLELPDHLFRSAKSLAAQQGISLKTFVTEALQEKVSRTAGTMNEQPWMKHFGSLAHLRKESRRIEQVIEREFEKIEDPE